MVECVHVGHGCPGLNRLSLAIKGYNFSTETVVKSKIELDLPVIIPYISWCINNDLLK